MGGTCNTSATHPTDFSPLLRGFFVFISYFPQIHGKYLIPFCISPLLYLTLPSFIFLHVFLQLTHSLFTIPTQNASLSPMLSFSHCCHFFHQKKNKPSQNIQNRTGLCLVLSFTPAQCRISYIYSNWIILSITHHLVLPYSHLGCVSQMLARSAVFHQAEYFPLFILAPNIRAILIFVWMHQSLGSLRSPAAHLLKHLRGGLWLNQIENKWQCYCQLLHQRLLF